MKLYIYDHCPFCVRARMIFGLRGMPVEKVVLQNDDEATPIGMIGAKQVPILQKDDGSYMGESLDIVRYVDGLSGKGPLPEAVRPEIQAWLDRVNAYVNKLVQPRMVLLDLPEFETQSAIDYFVGKKEKTINSFSENIAKTDEYLGRLNADLADLEQYVAGPQALNGSLSMEDILVFPLLRNLTVVKGLSYPAKVQAYVEAVSAASDVPLYFDKAV
ncbi:glutaredoxin 2 [Neisseria weaveri]|uniref:Glutaredoxin n=1 Tax=Neisseria weaveri TaxID=28091 RepID=A0A448VPY4_9NEIS|nr:glutaredoxin 2 [Neisseria weaveri]EGV35433.1 glutaredoxin, GrxB family [Neisseria weaveri ATCC 51223]EGV37818.1 glutaredoxin, GrxB family [Neisseria weaveri LMG 5135]SAY50404.1 glutaredoxin [Neisseria weaveri]VEJ51813.1 glutaredoxin [Neisseria weaveri]